MGWGQAHLQSLYLEDGTQHQTWRVGLREASGRTVGFGGKVGPVDLFPSLPGTDALK